MSDIEEINCDDIDKSQNLNNEKDDKCLEIENDKIDFQNHLGFLPKTTVKFEKEIRQLLSAYDDGEEPDKATIQVLDDILCNFVTKKALRVGKKGKVNVEDILYVVKNDKVKYYRAKELLKLNEQLKNAKKFTENDLDMNF